MEIPDDMILNEKGNTWLCDDDGNHVAWLKVGDKFIEVTITPGNSPGLFLRIVSEDEKEISRHVNENLSGWTVRRCNIDGIKVEDGAVA